MGAGNSTTNRQIAPLTNFIEENIVSASDLKEDPAETNKIHASLRLHFACTNLKDIPNVPEPNTVLVLKEKKGYASWALLGQTETVFASKNPAYSTSLKISYYPEEMQRMLLEVYEVTSYREQSQYKPLCSVEFNLYELIKSANQAMTLTFRTRGKLEETREGQVKIMYEFDKSDAVEHIVHSEFSIASCQHNAEYFFTISRAQHLEENAARDSSMMPPEKILIYNSYKGEYHVNDQKYQWKTVELPASILALDNFATPLYVTVGVFEEETRTNEKGEVEKSGIKILLEDEVTIESMLAKEASWTLCKDSKTYGTFKISNTEAKQKFAFEDYVKGGLTLHLTTGIDFALTNYFPTDPRSLHTSDLLTNPYAQIIKYIGSPILQFDPVKKIALLGLGGRVPSVGVSHCFAVNGNIVAPEVEGIAPALRAYFTARDTIEFSGPTKLGEILKFIGDAVEDYTKNSFSTKKKYFVALIIVDCSPSDMEETKEQLVRCSSLPMSVIVAGLRNNMCRELEETIHPTILIYSAKQQVMATRVAAQYVSYELMKGNMRLLAKGVIDELQRQVMEYCFINNFKPDNLSSEPTVHPSHPEDKPGEDVVLQIETRPYAELIDRIKREVEEIALRNKKEEENQEEGHDYYVEGTSRHLVGDQKIDDASPAGNLVLKGTEFDAEKDFDKLDEPAGEKGAEKPKDLGMTSAKTMEKTDMKEANQNLDTEEEEEKVEIEEEMFEIEKIEPLLMKGFPTRKLLQMKQVAEDKAFKNVLLEAMNK